MQNNLAVGTKTLHDGVKRDTKTKVKQYTVSLYTEVCPVWSQVGGIKSIIVL